MRCEEARSKILEQTLEGSLAPTAGLADHLNDCAACLDWQTRLREVDLALRAAPVESMPAWSLHQALARFAAADPRPEPFLPWTLWLPIGSLLLGLLWAYLTLVWPAGPGMIHTFDPAVADWLVRFEAWVASQQATLNVVALSVGMGLLFTLLAVGLGLYVGRDRVAPRHSH